MDENQDKLDGSTIAALGLWAMVGSVALMLFGRSLAGAFDEPVSWAVPVLTTAVVASASLAAWTLFHLDSRRGDVGRRTFEGLLAMIPAGLAGFATAVNATPVTLAVVCVLLLCGLAYIAVREGVRPSGAVLSSQPAVYGQSPATPADAVKKFEQVSKSAANVPDTSDDDSPEQQQVIRRCLPDGGEEIEAVLIAQFEAGQRQTAVHLPIYPVLRSVPHVDCEPLDDASVSVRPTAVHGYGVRIEVKRTESVTTDAEVPIGVLITSTARRESAA